MANSNLQNGVNANEINAANAATVTPAPVAEQKEQQTVQTSRRTMLCLLIVAIAIANIPGLTVTYLFLFYGTLRASTLLPTVMTLLGKKLTGKGVFAGVLTALCVGLPIFAYGNLAGIPAVKAAGSLTTVLSSGLVAVIASRKAVKA